MYYFTSQLNMIGDFMVVLGDTENNDIRYIDKLIFTIWLNIDYN